MVDEGQVKPLRQPRRWLFTIVGLAGCLGAAAVVVTWRHPPRPVQHIVSGRAGLRTTASGANERWTQGAVTITIDPTLAQATPAARDAIVRAFGAWASTRASLPQLSFDATSTPGQAVQDGVNRLLFGPITVAGHEDNLAVTISYADESTGDILEADTIFNSGYDWTSMDPASGSDPARCDRRYDLQNVATHEAGHFFGLGEDYDDQSTTMYVSSELCQTSKRVLSPSDVSAASGLYAGVKASAPARACNVGMATGR